MSVLMTADKKELIVTCKCGCEDSFHIMIDDQDKDYDCYGFLCFMKGNFNTEYKYSLWRSFKIKCKKLWCILRNKDYCYSETIMSKEQFEVFKEYINQF